MSWEKYVSKTHNIPFWYNPKTGKSVWTKPDETWETKVDTYIDGQKIYWEKYMSKTHNVPFWYNPKTGESVWTKPDDTSVYKVDATKIEETTDMNLKKKAKVEKNFKDFYENEPCSISVVSSNGMYGSIRCASNSKWDQMEALRDLNESMRDLYR